MNDVKGVLARLLAPVLVGMLLTGCATTPKIDWNSRIGSYTYEQAVMDFGPPDKYARLTDGTTVAEWLTRRGYTTVHGMYGYGYSPWFYGPYYPGYIDSYTSPDYYLRLIFGPDNRLKAWKTFYK